MINKTEHERITRIMDGRKKVQKQYSEETGKDWMVVVKGNEGYATWDYQRWLEDKLSDATSPKEEQTPMEVGISRIREVMTWLSQCVDADHELEVSEIKSIWNNLSESISLLEYHVSQFNGKEAVEFAEWIAENQYTHFGFPPAHKWMCEKEGDDNTYTTQELYTLFLNTKNTKP